MFDFFFWRRELLPLPYSREIHCHLIPGVDDGSQSMKFSLKALETLEDLGVEKVIFTPHFTNPKFLNTPDKILPIFNELKARAEEEELDIECESFSFEYRVDKTFEQLYSSGQLGDYDCEIRPLRNKWILIENGWRGPYENLLGVVEKLQADGYFPILAHPERYGYYVGLRGKNYHFLQEKGIRFQCNILSFSGYYGETEKEMAYWLLNHGYVNFLGSDMHNPQHLSLLEKFLRSKKYSEIYDDLEDSIMNDRLGK